MINLQEGDYPDLKVTHQDLPFNAADAGQTFEIVGKVKIDSFAPEGPTISFKVLEIEFPEKEEGTIKSRKKQRNIKATPGVTINITR